MNEHRKYQSTIIAEEKRAQFNEVVLTKMFDIAQKLSLSGHHTQVVDLTVGNLPYISKTDYGKTLKIVPKAWKGIRRRNLEDAPSISFWMDSEENGENLHYEMETKLPGEDFWDWFPDFTEDRECVGSKSLAAVDENFVEEKLTGFVQRVLDRTLTKLLQ